MTLDGYVLYEPIGFGAKGPIWRAVDQQGRNFALQVLGAQLSPGLEERIIALQKLDSQHVLRIVQLRKVTDGRYVVLSEFLEGQNLEILRAGRRFSAEQLGFIARSLVSGLADLHEAGLRHGDIAPANAMVTTHGRVLWVDVLGSEEGTTLAFRDSGFRGEGGTDEAEEVFAFAQMMLTLGMDPQLLGQALHPDPTQRPQLRTLCQAWQTLPTAGIELLTPSELTSAKMRAAGRDVTTTTVSPHNRQEFPLRDRRKTRRSPRRERFHPLTRDTSPTQSLQWMKIAIPALGGAAAVLAGALMVPRLLPAADALPEATQTAMQVTASETAAPSVTALPRPGEILAPQSRNAAETSDATDRETDSETAPKASHKPESASDSETDSTPGKEAAPENLLPPAGPETTETEDLLQTGKITTDEEAAAVLQELLTRRDKALQSGHIKDLAALTVKASVAQKADAELLARLESSQTRVTGLATAVKSAEIVNADKTQVRLRATLSQGAYTQTDRIGNQHQVAALPDARQELLLMRHPWRIASVTRLQ